MDSWVPRFEGPERDAWQKPAEVVRALGLPPDARVADLGSGTGYFAVRLARAVPGGRVTGIDLEPNMVRYLEERAAREGLANLTCTLATPDNATLPEPVDLLLLANTYHHLEGRPTYLARLAAALGPGGRLVVLDFRKGDLPVGPPDEMKLAPEAVRAEVEQAGFALVGEEMFLPYQYFLVFRRR